MTKEKELVKNTIVITAGKVCTRLVSFFLLPFYTAILSAEEYGTVDLVMTYSTLLLPFITLALEQALFRFLLDVRGNKEMTGRYISTTVFISGMLLIAAIAIIGICYLLTGNDLLLCFALVLTGSVISANSLQICRGLGDNAGYTLCSMITAITQIICNLIFIALFRWGSRGMMLATFLGQAVSGIIPLFRCHLLSYLKLRFIDKKVFKELSAYAMPMIPNQLSWWVLNASDKVIVQFFLGVAGNGLIAVANKFSGVYIQFSDIFNISWTESAALHINDADAECFFSETINTVFRLFLCACCMMIVCISFLFPFLINEQFKEAYGLIPVFLLASLCNAVVSLYGVIYVAHKKSVEIAKTTIYAAVLNIMVHLILIHDIGIYAAPVSTVIGYGSMAVFRYFHSRKYLVIKFSNTTLLLSVIMLLISFWAYYSNEKVIQTAAFLTVTILSVVLNRNILKFAA